MTAKNTVLDQVGQQASDTRQLKAARAVADQRLNELLGANAVIADLRMQIACACELLDIERENLSKAVDTIADLRAQLASAQIDAARYRYIEDNCSTQGGGRGFAIDCFVPVDEEDMGVGIDKAIAARAQITNKNKED